MKKRITLLLFVLTIAATFICSCTNGGGNTQTPTDGIVGNYVYKSGSNLNFVVSQSLASEKILTSDGIELDNPEFNSKYVEIANTLRSALDRSEAGLNLVYVNDGVAKAQHEVILGRCDREISRQAYRELEKLPDDDGKSKFLIYSNGSSVAIAFDDEDYDVAKIATDYFIENHVNNKTYLVLEVGYIYKERVDMIAYYEEQGKKDIENQWARLEENVLDDYKKYYGADNEQKAVELAEATIEALKVFYSSFDKDKLISWFANLYEPQICICNAVDGSTTCKNTPFCGGAGFYFSNSGRDTIGFMPDLESTMQTFGFLKKSGMLDAVGGNIAAAFPDGEVEKIVKWTKALQDADDGYFYHPQWSKQETQANYARMGRDLGHAVSILKAFGEKPNYDTPSGVSGDSEILPTSSLKPSESYLTGRFTRESKVLAVSRVVAVAETSVPSFLESEAAFKKYLSGFNIKINSYIVGNEISSVAEQIKARDKELAAMGASYSLTDILMDWFAENQNPENGTWHWANTDDPYYANNGVLKIVAAYNTLGREFPNPILAIDNAVKALTCDTPINHVCDLYNTWFAINFICENLRKHGNSEAASDVIWALREQAPAAIKATTIKMAACQCDDGSYSYHPGKTQTTSQGLPVAAPTPEGDPAKGDVNATVICTYGNITYIFGALGFSGAPSICTEGDRLKFKDIIADLGQVIKNAEIDPYDPETFDTHQVGNSPEGYTFLKGTTGAESSLKIKEDYRENSFGNIMHFHSDYSSWDRFVIGTKTGIGGDAFVFESDICFENVYKKASDGTISVPESGYLMQLFLGSGESATRGFYAVTAKIKDGSIYLYDMSSTKDGDTSSQYTELYEGIEFGEWFHIKIEYFRLDETTARAKVYVGETRENMELVRVSDNFFDYYAGKIDNPNATAPAIGVYSSSMLALNTNYEQDVYFDNLCAYRSRTNYRAEEMPLNKNVDGPDQDEVRYIFSEMSELPEEINVISGDGTVSISDDGYLKLNGGKFELPANYRTSGANIASFSADIIWDGAEKGDKLMSVRFTEGSLVKYDVIGFDFVVKEIDGTNYLVLHESNRKEENGDVKYTTGAAITLVKIEAGVPKNISIDFYHEQNVALLYINGEFITASDAVYKNTSPRIIDNIIVESGVKEISLDNLVFERRKFDFAVAVEPETPSNVHEFDDLTAETNSGVIFENVSLKDGYAEISSIKSAVKIPLEVRSPMVSAHLVRFTLIPGETNGETVRMGIVDTDGNIIIAVDVFVEQTIDGTLVEIYEAGKGGRYGLVIGKKMVGYGENVVLSIIWYPSDKTANIEVCGDTIAATSVCYDAGVYKNKPSYGAVWGIGAGAVSVDNMVAESLYKYRAPVTLEGENPDNKNTVLNYDFSTATNIPKSLTISFEAGGSCVRIEQALKKIGAAKEEYSKALVLQSNSGGNDRFTFKPSNTTAGANRVVFESEMMISSESDKSAYLFQLMFTDPAWQTRNITYMPTVGIIGDKVVLTDFSVTGGNTATNKRYENNFVVLGNVDEWFKLRIEYYQGTKETVRIVIKVNDGESVDIVKRSTGDSNKLEVIDTVRAVVSDNYYGYLSESAPDVQPRNDIKELLFYGQNGCKAVVYMDNTTFFGDGATCINNEVNLIKIEK